MLKSWPESSFGFHSLPSPPKSAPNSTQLSSKLDDDWHCLWGTVWRVIWQILRPYMERQRQQRRRRRWKLFPALRKAAVKPVKGQKGWPTTVHILCHPRGGGSILIIHKANAWQPKNGEPFKINAPNGAARAGAVQMSILICRAASDLTER